MNFLLNSEEYIDRTTCLEFPAKKRREKCLCVTPIDIIKSNNHEVHGDLHAIHRIIRSCHFTFNISHLPLTIDNTFHRKLRYRLYRDSKPSVDSSHAAQFKVTSVVNTLDLNHTKRN